MGNLEIKSNIKIYKVDFDKVKSLEDVVLVLNALDLTIFTKNDEIPDNIKPLFDKGFIKEIAEEKHFLRKDEP